jgi:hypothetical protein
MRMISLRLVEVVTLGEHAVEFVYQEGNGLVALVGGDDRIHVGSMDGDVTLGLELGGDRLIAVTFKLHADTDDALLVSEQSVGFLTHIGFQGRREFEVNAGYD